MLRKTGKYACNCGTQSSLTDHGWRRLLEVSLRGILGITQCHHKDSLSNLSQGSGITVTSLKTLHPGGTEMTCKTCSHLWTICSIYTVHSTHNSSQNTIAVCWTHIHFLPNKLYCFIYFSKTYTLLYDFFTKAVLITAIMGPQCQNHLAPSNF